MIFTAGSLAPFANSARGAEVPTERSLCVRSEKCCICGLPVGCRSERSRQRSGLAATGAGDYVARPAHTRRGVVAVAGRTGDEDLERRLYPPSAGSRPRNGYSRIGQRSTPSCAGRHDLGAAGGRISRQAPDGFSYGCFCEHYRAWSGRLSQLCGRRISPVRRYSVMTPAVPLLPCARFSTKHPPPRHPLTRSPHEILKSDGYARNSTT
jgi:hypothetical protein